MSRLQPTSPNTLRVWQQNARKSQTAHEHILNTANPSEWDIILIQEPWIDTYGNARGNNYFRAFYPSPRTPGSNTPFRSFTLVNTNIATDDYQQINIPSHDITAIQFRNEHGHLAIFNIYNDCTHNNALDALDEYLNQDKAEAACARDQMAWFGDFNRHHPLWEEPRNRHLFQNNQLTEPLLDMISKYGMNMALPEGIPTLEASTTRNWTRPDNVWYSHAETNPFITCDVDPTLRPPITDHLPIISVIDISLGRSTAKETRNFREVSWENFSKYLDTQLANINPPMTLRTIDRFNEATDNLIRAIKLTIEKTVPISKPNPFKKRWWTKELTELRKKKTKLSNEAFRFRDIPDHPAKTEYRQISAEYAKLIKQT